MDAHAGDRGEGGERSREAASGGRGDLRPVPPEEPMEPSHHALWLASCHAFLVDYEDGTPFGVVDDVVEGPDGRAVALLVAPGAFGRRVTVLTPDEIVEIRPVERRVIVAGQPERPPPRRWWTRGR